jgi:hypothetical protein
MLSEVLEQRGALGLRALDLPVSAAHPQAKNDDGVAYHDLAWRGVEPKIAQAGDCLLGVSVYSRIRQRWRAAQGRDLVGWYDNVVELMVGYD